MANYITIYQKDYLWPKLETPLCPKRCPVLSPVEPSSKIKKCYISEKEEKNDSCKFLTTKDKQTYLSDFGARLLPCQKSVTIKADETEGCLKRV